MRIRVNKAALAKSVVSIVGRYSGLTLLNDIAELAEAFGYDPRGAPATVEAQARDIVSVALADAFLRTLERAAHHKQTDQAQAAALSRAQAALPEQIDLSPQMFNDAGHHPAVEHIQATFITTLGICGVPATDQDRWLQVLRENYVIALDGEFRTGRTNTNGPRYDLLDSYFNPTPAGEQASRALNWQRYRRKLIHDVRQPLLNFDRAEANAVSLEDLYIRGRCWYERRVTPPNERPRTERVITWLDDQVKAWLTARDPYDAVRLLSGEMGCGKSSFAKMLAADLAKDNCHVVVLPLHRLALGRSDVRASVGEYMCERGQLGHDPFSPEAQADYTHGHSGSPLLVIFDGLDELTTREGPNAEAATGFVTAADRLIQTANQSGLCIQAMFVGRPLAVADVRTLTEPGTRLHVLRFRYDQNDIAAKRKMVEGDWDEGQDGRQQERLEVTFDPRKDEDALSTDQSQQWWRRFQSKNRQAETGIPIQFDGNRAPEPLRDLLAQPLLNFLLALTADEDVDYSLSGIYDSVFKDLFDRETAGGRHASTRMVKSEVLKQLGYNRFREILERVAISAWHAGDRTVTLRDIEDGFKVLDAEPLLSHVQSATIGLKTILNSFFVESRKSSTADAFDFTHKSFREYLTASYLVKTFRRIAHLTTPSENTDQMSQERAIAVWMQSTAYAVWDKDLQRFVIDEVRAWPEESPVTLVQAKDCFRCLFDRVLRRGLGVPSVPQRIRAQHIPTLADLSANTEAAFLALLGACHQVLKPRGPAANGESGPGESGQASEPKSNDWFCAPSILVGTENPRRQDETAKQGALYRLLSRLRARAGHQEDMLIWYAVAVLDGAQINASARFGEGSLRNRLVSFGAIDLTGWHFQSANLVRAKLEDADLVRANLRDADLRDADLRGADLRGAKLVRANLADADLLRAKLEDADLVRANLVRANLRDADLRDADLRGADLLRAKLEDADLRGANLVRANLRDADLRDADLAGANLAGAHLTNAIVDPIRPAGIKLDGAIGIPKAWQEDPTD